MAKAKKYNRKAQICRSIMGILLLLCLLIPIAATYSILQGKKSMVRKAIKRKMKAEVGREALVLLTFSKAESKSKLRWEHSKEFEYNHQMYDVIEKYSKGDSIYYWCWWDHEETALNKQLKDLAAQVFGTSPARKESQEKLFSFYKTLYCSKPKAVTCPVAQVVPIWAQVTRKAKWAAAPAMPTQFLAAPAAPPPEMAGAVVISNRIRA